MFQASGLAKRYGSRTLFEGVTLTLQDGDRVGLVGPNGAGKTTLLRVLAGELSPDDGGLSKSRGLSIGYLAQDVAVTWSGTVLSEVAAPSGGLLNAKQAMEALELELTQAGPERQAALLERYGELAHDVERLGGYDRETEARRILSGLGFAEADLTRAATTFSGGWRMRIALARMLLDRPDVLLLDEPTNHLDLGSRDWFENTLLHYEGAVLAVSHDRYFLNRVASRIAAFERLSLTMYAGASHEGAYEAYVAGRELARARLIAEKGAQDKALAEAQLFIDRFRAKATKARQVQSRVKRLEKIERIEVPNTPKTLRSFAFPSPPRSGRISARLEGLSVGYDPARPVLTGVDLTLERGWKVAIVGPNGAGKSTLLKLLAGQLSPSAGTFELGHNVTRGYYAQHQLEALDPRHTVLESMDVVATEQTRLLVRSVLGAMLFSGEDAVRSKVAVLSGGEKARLALARLLLAPVPLLLMDEPTNHLDLDSRERLEDALDAYEGTLVLVSHDRWFMNSVCDHVVLVNDGAVRLMPGTYDEVMALEAQPAVTAEPEPPPESDPRRDKKRQEAEARQRAYRATKALRDEVARLEATIATLEGRQAAVDAALADPVTYADPRRAQELSMERPALQQQLAEAYARWEAASLSIEEATARELAR